MHVLAIAGSLRKASLSRQILDEAILHAPPGMHVEVFPLDALPLYDGDRDVDDARPPAVVALKDALTRAEGVLVVTPEYNASIPGVLKNAIDWASRPAYRSPFVDKPCALVGISSGSVGGARALAHLKDVLLGVLARPLPVPDHLVPFAGRAKDDGSLIDDALRARLATLLARLATEIEGQRRLRALAP